MITREERAAQKRLDALGEAYKTALYAKPRDEEACLFLAREMLELCQGTRLETSAIMRLARHEKGETR